MCFIRETLLEMRRGDSTFTRLGLPYGVIEKGSNVCMVFRQMANKLKAREWEIQGLLLVGWLEEVAWSKELPRINNIFNSGYYINLGEITSRPH